MKQDNESLRDLVNNLTNLALAITEDRKEYNKLNNNNSIKKKKTGGEIEPGGLERIQTGGIFKS